MAFDSELLEKTVAGIAAAKATWKAGHTALLDLSAAKRRARLGYVPGSSEPSLAERESRSVAARSAPAPAGAALPKTSDWRNRNGNNYVTGIKDQGSCGSCVAFGTCGALDITVRIVRESPFESIASERFLDLSEAQLFYCGGGSCQNGWNVTAALDYAQGNGLAPEVCFPYTAGDQGCKVAVGWTDRATKISASTSFTSTSDMKTWLANTGVLITCFTVYEDFYSYSSGVYKKTSNVAEGGHCVCVVGYDDNQQAWICRNSWGTSWGEGGYFLIGYGECGIDATMWGIKSFASIYRAPGLWHTVRNANGTWQASFGLIPGQEQNDPGPFSSLCCAGVGSQAQFIGIVSGQLWHTIRNSDGSWQSAFGLIEGQEQNNPGPFTAISCAGVGNQLHAVGIVGGQLWHTIRNADGSWQKAFGLIESQEQNNPGAFSAISCAGVGNQLHVVGIVGGQLWHTIRNSDGTWQKMFGLIESQEQNNPGTFSSITCGGVGNQLQVVGIVGGQLWHTIRSADGSWQKAFGLIESQEQNNPGAFSAVSAAGVGSALQVAGIVGGQLWHTIRNDDGSWQKAFGLIESQEQNHPGAFNAMAVAGVGDKLQVAGMAP